MSEARLRPAMAWIHGWLGLVAGWLLFAMFLTGTASYFRVEITRWMQPERRSVTVPGPAAARAAIAELARTAPGAAEWIVYLPTDRDPTSHAYVEARAGQKAARTDLDLESATGLPIAARDTQGGDLFFRFHYSLGLPGAWGEWLAGLCAIAMFAAILSGVITHKRIFADFFTLRWGKGQRSWLDGHNLVAVLGLPYHLVITYSGLITLSAMYMPWPVKADYAGTPAYYAEAYRDGPAAVRTGRAAPGVPIDRIVADAERRWCGTPSSSLSIAEPGDAGAIVTVVAQPGAGLTARGASLAYRATTGQPVGGSTPDGPALATLKTLFGMHLAYFSGPELRSLLFLLGLSGTAMVGTGLVLWTVKRGGPAPSFGWRLAARLNVATIACLPAAMAAYFLANRLIPADLAARATGEVRIFYGVWAGLAVAAATRPLRAAWIETLGIGTALFLAVVIADLATVGAPRDALFVSFDAAMLLAAALLGFAARAVARPTVPRLRVRPHREAAHVG